MRKIWDFTVPRFRVLKRVYWTDQITCFFLQPRFSIVCFVPQLWLKQASFPLRLLEFYRILMWHYIYIYMYMIAVWCVYIQIDRVICGQPKVWQASRRKMRSGQTSQTKKPHQTMSQRSFSLKAQPNRRDGAQDLSKQIYRNVIKCKYTHAWRYSYI